MSLAQVKADLDAARVAILDRDYDAALHYALAAQMLLAGIPDQTRGENRLAFSTQENLVDAMIKSIRQQQGAALAASPTAVRRRNVVYRNPTS